VGALFLAALGGWTGAAAGPPRALPTAVDDPPDVVFRQIYWREKKPVIEVTTPPGPGRAVLEGAARLPAADWEERVVGHPAVAPAPLRFEDTPAAGQRAGFYRVRFENDGTLVSGRIRCLYNGYFLTVHPGKALAADSTADRYRLYVLHALLINPGDGRIAAVYPPLDDTPPGSGNGARPAASYPELTSKEHPPPPAMPGPTELLAWWRANGVAPALLEDVDFLDLQGAVATPGILDTHFHVTSWSKKIPDPGERFGFYADMSDPAYYLTPDGEARCTRGALWRVVADACAHLAAHDLPGNPDQPGIFLHGFLHARVDDPGPDGEPGPGEFLFSSDTPEGVASQPNPAYVLNRVGRPPSGTPAVPDDVCAPGGASLPPPDYPLDPALLVHTSGQMCWFNYALLEAFNQQEREFWGTAFDPLDIASVTPPAGPGDSWELRAAAGADWLANATPPFPVDLHLSGNVPEAWAPFQVTAIDPENAVFQADPLAPEALSLLTNALPSRLELIPFYRTIPEDIPPDEWAAAAAFHHVTPATEGPAPGHWDPHHPYESNWYSGPERGLVQYAPDAAGHWHPTGRAEHYVMRDLLASVVIPEPTVADCIHFRRNLARWCHRHGITAVNDILFYRRRSNPQEFQAYQALSYDHQLAGDDAFFLETGLDPAVPTGRFFLRVGLYYYLENADQISAILDLARPAGGPNDNDLLRPPARHPEAPGWVRWLGWKIQFDGGTGARTLLSNAPLAKPETANPWPMTAEDGRSVTNRNHSFGLSTMTNDPEQVFDSRESAALYWLVRESDPASPWRNPRLRHNWTLLKAGLANWIGQSVKEEILADDLRRLNHVNMTNPPAADPAQPDPAARMAEKVRLLFEQVNSAYQRTLDALARIWKEQSESDVPAAVAAHCIGDAAVDLWVRAIGQIQSEVAHLPADPADLPAHWRAVVPDAATLAALDRSFVNRRYRVEHLLNVTPYVINRLRHPADGIDAHTTPATRNVCFSTQPSLLLLDGLQIATGVFPQDQELWELPHPGQPNFWGPLPALPRSPHHMPCPLYLRDDVPFCLNTDPPAVRDPRPALTVLAAVARTPVQLDPEHWLDQSADPPPDYPRDYLVGRVYPPLGKVAGAGANPMQLTVEQALCAMTWWGAYVSGQETELGALAPPPETGAAGWFADLVVWQANPPATPNRESPSSTISSRSSDRP